MPTAKLKPLLDDNYHFIIVVAEDKWETLSAMAQLMVNQSTPFSVAFDVAGDPIPELKHAG